MARNFECGYESSGSIDCRNFVTSWGDEDYALLWCYAASSGNWLLTFRCNLFGPETSVRNCHYSLRNNPEQSSSLLLRCENMKSRTPGDLLASQSGLYCIKSVPLQAWSGPEGSRKLRFPDFMTTAQEGGKVDSLKHRPHLPPGNSPGTHFC